MTLTQTLWDVRQRVSFQPALVLNLTNYVSVSFCANTLLAVGASPIMAHDPDDLQDLVKIASSVLINIGTLDKNFAKTSLELLKWSNELRLPVVLDPVGAGVSQLRLQTCLTLMREGRDLVIKANSSEVMALAGVPSASRGVDSLEDTRCAIQAAKTLLDRYHIAAVAITGVDDYVVDRETVTRHENGSPLMARITGTGCALGSLTGAMLARESNKALATRAAISWMGVAGELAARKDGDHVGNFMCHLLDAIDKTDKSAFSQTIRIHHVA